MKIIDADYVFRHLPIRPRESNKGNFGSLLSVCGCSNYRGAATLSVISALRCGVGLLRLASIEKVISAVASQVPEATFLPLNENEEGTIAKVDIEYLINKISKPTACLCGCGLGRSDDITALVNDLIYNAPCPLILDADALNSISGNTDILREAQSEVIITPHIGEFSRLSGLDIDEIKNSPSEAALEFARKNNCIVVLKDYKTVIAAPTGDTLLNTTGNAGLARGGSGDILAGMIAAFTAQGISPLVSAVCGVFLHGFAADRCAKRRSQYGMLPHDILDDLCDIFNENNR